MLKIPLRFYYYGFVIIIIRLYFFTIARQLEDTDAHQLFFNLTVEASQTIWVTIEFVEELLRNEGLYQHVVHIAPTFDSAIQKHNVKLNIRKF